MPRSKKNSGAPLRMVPIFAHRDDGSQLSRVYCGNTGFTVEVTPQGTLLLHFPIGAELQRGKASSHLSKGGTIETLEIRQPVYEKEGL